MASQTVQSVHCGNKCLEQRECQLLNVMSSSWRIRGPGSIRYDRSKWSPGSHLTMGKMPMASAGVSEMLSSVQSLSRVRLFATPWIAARQASLSITNSRVHWDSRPSSQWCHPAISSSVVPFSSCPQSLPKSESFPVSQLFAWGGQSIGVSASASVLPMNIQDWFLLGWTGWISLKSKGLSESINSLVLSFLYGPTLTSVHDY